MAFRGLNLTFFQFTLSVPSESKTVCVPLIRIRREDLMNYGRFSEKVSLNLFRIKVFLVLLL